MRDLGDCLPVMLQPLASSFVRASKSAFVFGCLGSNLSEGILCASIHFKRLAHCEKKKGGKDDDNVKLETQSSKKKGDSSVVQ